MAASADDLEKWKPFFVLYSIKIEVKK